MTLVMNETEKTLFDIVKHVEEHGNYLICNDIPKQLKIGYFCTKTTKDWHLRLTQIKIDIYKDDFLHKTILDNMINRESRLELIKILQKASKLKAFW